MTAFDRVERHLPELLEELAGAGVPDYFDDMLRSTTQARQRPAWSSLERWLPMGVIALTAPARRVPLRYLAFAGAVLLIAAAALVYVGSRPRAVPPPFGPARNGLIVYATAGGDLDSLDPVTGTTRTVIGGASAEQYPAFSLDGTRLVFARKTGDSSVEADFVAAADGSGIRSLVSGPTIKWYYESGSGDRALVSRIVATGVVQSMVDMTTGKETRLDVDPALGITGALFRPGHDQILYEHVPDNGLPGATVYLGKGDGSGPLQPLAIAADAINDIMPSDDGSKLVYSTWTDDVGQQGRIHVFDIDTGKDTPLMFDGSTGTNELFAQFSPDGGRLALMRWGRRRPPGRDRAGGWQGSRDPGRPAPASTDGQCAAPLVARRIRGPCRLRHRPLGLAAADRRNPGPYAPGHGLEPRHHLATPRPVGASTWVRPRRSRVRLPGPLRAPVRSPIRS